MRSRARLPGRPMLTLLGALTVALLGIAVVFDLIDLVTGTGAFTVAACWTLTAGLASGLLAALLALIAWRRGLPDSHDRRGALHGIGKLLVLALFAASWLLRDVDGLVPHAAVSLSLAGAVLALANTLLCGEFGLRRRARVDAGADPDPPGSSGFREPEDGPASVA